MMIERPKSLRPLIPVSVRSVYTGWVLNNTLILEIKGQPDFSLNKLDLRDGLQQGTEPDIMVKNYKPLVMDLGYFRQF